MKVKDGFQNWSVAIICLLLMVCVSCVFTSPDQTISQQSDKDSERDDRIADSRNREGGGKGDNGNRGGGKGDNRNRGGGKGGNRNRGGGKGRNNRVIPTGPVFQQLGLIKYDKDKVYNGYTLFAPKHYEKTYLMGMSGQVYKEWTSEYEPGQSVYLLENGNLLRCCFTKNQSFIGGGEGGRMEEYDWDGNMVWSMWYSDDTKLSHHDIEPMPNGNLLVMVVQLKTKAECIAAGFDAGMMRSDTLFPESIIEIERFGSQGFEIVWEWQVWDHLIQDRNKNVANYGSIKDNPGRVDCNAGRRRTPAFWNHANSIDYNEKFNQICLNARGQNEFWIIDHTTTTEEAKGSTGGKYGKGGDLLYRWGNPAVYGGGSADDQRLYLQHDSQWIEDDCPGAGNFLVYNNGSRRGYSSVDEIDVLQDEEGFFPEYKPGQIWGPKDQTWIYTTTPKEDMYSTEISGASRLPNGNTLVCAGTVGHFLEVEKDGNIVWEYRNPVARDGQLREGDGIPLDVRGHQYNAVFKIRRYAPDYPAFQGKEMTPIMDSLVLPKE